MLYQCIHCGKEQDMGSREVHLCSDCGYKMFPAPFDKKEVLRQEIYHYLKALAAPPMEQSDIAFFRFERSHDGTEKERKVFKEEDDNRFPDFEKLYHYVCAAKRTEVFHERLKQSVGELRNYLHTPYTREYQVDLTAYQEKVEAYDKDIHKVLKALSITETIGTFEVPAITVRYTETPDNNILPVVDALLDSLDALSAKIEAFIRQNNIYGTGYQYDIDLFTKEVLDKESGLLQISDALKRVSLVVKKEYEVDILSDGRAELEEMLRSLWSSIYLLMSVSVLQKQFTYTFSDGITAENGEFGEIITKLCARRCPKIVQLSEEHLFLNDYLEERLIELYDEMISIDSQGILGISKNCLLSSGKGERQLQSLIGLRGIKESILKMKAFTLAMKDTGNLNLHMCFYGNPGTGKTEVARLIADILYENHILPTNNFVEVDRSGLVGQYVGETPQKTMRVIQQAMGGVLFIDEAYALVPKDGGGWDYGHEAIATLVKAMEDFRGKFCVILAGYKNEMEKLLSTNPGFASRIQFTLDFPNYSRPELGQIMKLMLDKRKYTIADPALQKILDITDIKRKSTNFANAREIRNILDQVIMCQSMRVLGTGSRELGLVDVEKYINDAKINLPQGQSSRRVLTGEEELEQLIGLNAVKRMVKKIKIYAMRNRNDTEFNLHMCFNGNPGTGKTEVARILSRILYDAGTLKEAKLVETDAYGLLGKFAGETAPKTMDKINEADGGVLFIDEAYALTSQTGMETNYGDEAIAVLLKEMEDRRGKFCVIFAGYKEEMKAMLSRNPGLESRIQFKLDFPDYTREELKGIAKNFLRKKGYDIQSDALECVLDIAESFRDKPNFANARTVRNILDQVLLNQNLRTDETRDDCTVILDDVEAYLIDEGIDLSKSEKKHKIGFV